MLLWDSGIVSLDLPRVQWYVDASEAQYIATRKDWDDDDFKVEQFSRMLRKLQLWLTGLAKIDGAGAGKSDKFKVFNIS